MTPCVRWSHLLCFFGSNLWLIGSLALWTACCLRTCRMGDRNMQSFCEWMYMIWSTQMSARAGKAALVIKCRLRLPSNMWHQEASWWDLFVWRAIARDTICCSNGWLIQGRGCGIGTGDMANREQSPRGSTHIIWNVPVINYLNTHSCKHICIHKNTHIHECQHKCM